MALPFLGVSGCDILDSHKARKKPWKTLETIDGRASIQVPHDWMLLDGLSLDHTLIWGSPMAIQVAVVWEPKPELSIYEAIRSTRIPHAREKGGLERKKALRAGGPTATDPELFTFGIYRAVRTEFDKEYEGIRMRYCQVIVEGPHNVHRLLFAAPLDLWTETRPIFDRIVRSFKQRGVPTPSARRRP